MFNAANLFRCGRDLVEILKTRDILIASKPVPINGGMLKNTSFCGKWLSMNVLAIDERGIIVDPHPLHNGARDGAVGPRADPVPVPILGVRRRVPLR